MGNSHVGALTGLCVAAVTLALAGCLATGREGSTAGIQGLPTSSDSVDRPAVPPLQELIAVAESPPVKLPDVLMSSRILGLVWWSSKGRRLLCVAGDDPCNFDDMGRPMALLQFYEEVDAILYLRYLYHCDLPLLGLSLLPGPDGAIVLADLEPSIRMNYIAFAAEGSRIRLVLDVLSWHPLELVDLNNDGVQEIIVRGEETVLGQATPEAEVYAYRGDAYVLVCTVPWSERLALRELPDRPLP